MSTRVQAALKKRFDYILNDENKYPGAPSVAIQSIDKNTPFLLGNKTVTPVEVMHHKMSVLGYRVDDFAYLTDVKTITKEEKAKLNNLEVLVVNALRIEPHPSHLNLDEALTLIEELNPKRAYLTHISHLLGFHAEVEKTLPEHVFLAYDNLEITTSL